MKNRITSHRRGPQWFKDYSRNRRMNWRKSSRYRKLFAHVKEYADRTGNRHGLRMLYGMSRFHDPFFTYHKVERMLYDEAFRMSATIVEHMNKPSPFLSLISKEPYPKNMGMVATLVGERAID